MLDGATFSGGGTVGPAIPDAGRAPMAPSAPSFPAVSADGVVSSCGCVPRLTLSALGLSPQLGRRELLVG